MARDFNGSNQRIDVDVNPDLGATFSMWAWIKTDTIASGQGGIINSDESSVPLNRNFQFRRNNDDVDFILFGSSGVETFTLADILNVTDNFFLGVVRRGGNLFMYHGTGTTLTEVDKGASGTPDNDSADIVIGARNQNNETSPTNFFDGKIGNVGLLNTVGLTGDEMIGVMHKGLSFRSPLITLPLLGAGSTEPDYSGNNTGITLINSPASADGFPVAPPFGFDLGWQGNFTSAVAAAGNPWYYYANQAQLAGRF